MSIPRIQSYAMPTQWPQAKPAWKIDAARSVLLVHDMQQYFVDFFDANQAPVPQLVANIQRLCDAAREAGVPIVYTAQPGNQDPRDRVLLTDFWGKGLSDEPEITRILPALQPQAGDTVMTKWRYSAFKRSPLEDWMRERGRDQLVICGVYAHIGCLMTAAEAFMLDVQPFLIADALGDFSLQEHEYALDYAAKRCAQINGTTQAIKAFRRARSAGFDRKRLRKEVAAQMEIDPDALRDDDDLLLMGLDSVRLMALVERWRRIGLAADFAELAEAPTLSSWADRLHLNAEELDHA